MKKSPSRPPRPMSKSVTAFCYLFKLLFSSLLLSLSLSLSLTNPSVTVRKQKPFLKTTRHLVEAHNPVFFSINSIIMKTESDRSHRSLVASLLRFTVQDFILHPLKRQKAFCLFLSLSLRSQIELQGRVVCLCVERSKF